MKAKMEQFPEKNTNPVLNVANEGVILYSNETGEPLLNEWDVKVGEKLPSHVGNIVQKVLSQNSPEKMEVKAGNRTYLVVFSPLPEQECVNISGFDISAQKKSEETFLENIQLYKTLFENTEYGFVLIEPIFDEAGNYDDYVILKINKCWEHKTGLKAAELLGKRINDVLPELEPIWSSTFGEVARKGKTMHFESYNHNSNKWYDLHVFPYQQGSVGVLFKDVTERKKNEEALKAAKEQMEAIFNVSTIAMGKLNAVRNSEGKIIDFEYKWLNDAAIKLSYDATGMRMLEKFPSTKDFGLFDLMVKTVEENLFTEIEIHYNAEGYDLWLYYKNVKLDDGVMYSCDDITERKKNEEALNKVHETLEKIVKERTEELEEAYSSLRENETVRKKEIHHRIKNNLQVISSLLDLQAEKFRGKKNIEDSQIIEAFNESQDRVISMALIHEELHKGRQIDTLNFSAYIQELADNLLLSYRLGNESTSLNTDIEKDIFFDIDTAVPLGIIVNELITNSLKYAFFDRDKGEITIRLYKEDSRECEIKGNKSTNYVLLISDNGIGVPEDLDIKNLDSLGLKLVTTLVEQLDGKFKIKKNKGTEITIRFTVPLQKILGPIPKP